MARNQFGGTCYRCGGWVAPGTGHFERHNKGWRVQHALHPGHGRVMCDAPPRKSQKRQDASARSAMTEERSNG